MFIVTENQCESNSEFNRKALGNNSSFLESPKASANVSRIEGSNTVLDFNFSQTKTLSVFQNYDQVIKQYVKKVKKMPLSKAEKSLFSVNSLFHKTNPGKIKIKDLIFSYSLYENTGEPSSGDKIASPGIKPRELSSDPNLYTRHKILKKVVEFLSFLSVKWKLFNHSAYHYRSNLRIQHSKILNLSVLNSKCYNLDTLWFCSVIRHDLLQELSTNSLKQYSRILEDHTNKIFEKLMENEFEQPNETQPKKSCCLNICKKKGAVSEELTKIEPSLVLPNFLSRKLSRSKYLFVVELYTLLQDFELCYRLFEKELVGRFINLSS